MINLTQRFQFEEKDPRISVFLSMTDYGLVVSGIGGAMYGMALLLGLPNGQSADIATVLIAIVLGLIFGGLIGLFYGALASPILGFAMALFAAVFCRDGRRPRLLKLTFAALTAVVIFLVSPLDVVKEAFAQVLQGSSINPLADFSAIAVYFIAIYLSQIVARKYLRQVSARRRKDKAS